MVAYGDKSSVGAQARVPLRVNKNLTNLQDLSDAYPNADISLKNMNDTESAMSKEYSTLDRNRGSKA